MRQHLKQTVIGVGTVLHDTTSFAYTAFVVQGLDGGEITTADALGCPHHPLQCLAVKFGAAAIPGSKAPSQDALCGASVESLEDFGTHASFLQFPEEVEALLCFLDNPLCLHCPGEILSDVYSQEFELFHPFHCSAPDLDG